MPFFSIVIPSYGNVDYLPACLDSLIGQSFEDWEAVVVDDCSNDGSVEVLNDYAERDSRIVLMPSNQGLHRARKSGVEKVAGKFIAFLDPDDEFENDALYRIKEALENEDADMLHFGIDVVSFGVPEGQRSSFESYVNKPCSILREFPLARVLAISKTGGLLRESIRLNW